MKILPPDDGSDNEEFLTVYLNGTDGLAILSRLEKIRP
jgi:hypothetical protein